MATIRDVAKMCGVSTATVSNVLNARSTKVSADTRRKVLRAVRALRYRPTPLEQSQRAILTNNLALVCGDLTTSPIITNHYLGRIFDGILEAAAFQRWSVTVFVERMWTDSGDAVRRSYDGRCDGVIALAPHRDCALVPDLVERGVPIVSVGTTVDLSGVSSVDIDNQEAGFELTRYLIEIGHRNIAYFGPSWTVASSLERCLGYRKAMHEANLHDGMGMFLSMPRTLVRTSCLEEEAEWPETRMVSGGADELARTAFAKAAIVPTAIICWNEEYARLVCCTLENPNPKFHFTTMRQPFHKIGVRAVEILITKILSPDVPDQSVRFKAQLVVRGSTRPLQNCIENHSRQDCIQQSVPMEVTHK
jgi:DNA-binding LacI/PurR family transcriptional regulator